MVDAAGGGANESWWRSLCLQSRMEPVGSTGARDVPGETTIFRGQAVEVYGKHCPDIGGDGVLTGAHLSKSVCGALRGVCREASVGVPGRGLV